MQTQSKYKPGDLVRILDLDSYYDSFIQRHSNLIGEIIEVNSATFEKTYGHWDIWFWIDDGPDRYETWIPEGCVEPVFLT